MSQRKTKNAIVRVLAFVFAFAMTMGIFAPYAPAEVSAARFSFVGEDSNVTTNIMLNGKDTGAIYTRVHLGSGGSSGYGANRIINIVEANPSKYPNLSFEVINSGTYNKNAQPLTSEVAKFNEPGKTILAAVNGDWMSWVNSLGASVSANYRVSFSPLVADGEICCSQMTSIEQAADYYTMCITKDNQIVIDKPTVDTTIKNTTKGTSITPTGLNRAPVNNSLNVYNNRLNDSNYVSSDAYEVVITTDSTNKFYQKQAVTGTVTNIYPAGTVSRCGLTDNIVILTARGNKISSLNGKFSIGDRVSITAEIKCDTNSSAWANCEEAIGGQCRVMKGGKIVNDLSGADMNQYPTNIIGYKSDGTVMMCMVTADTNGKYVGLDFNSNIATFCKEVGYDTCFLFDGGGSTTMVTLDAGKYVERACYSDGQIRNVWNGLALVYDANANGSSNPPAPPVLSSASQIAAGETKLTQNITGNLTVTEGTYVIDLAGFTWSNDNVALEVDGTANVTIIDSVGGGKISVYPNDAINAYGGSLTLNGVTVEADGSGMDAIFVKAGNILVKNSTLIAPKAGIDASQSDTAATIVVDGGTFGVYAGAEDKSRSCAIEFRNDNKNITLKGDIKFENNVIIRRNDCTKELEQLITFGDESKDSTITNTDKTYSNDSNTWRFSTIDYKYTASSVPTAKPTTQPTAQPTTAPTVAPTVLSSASQIAAGETKLTQNITGNLTVTEGTYVIDLAGFTWSNDNVALEVDGTANVTIIDSVGGGKISVYPNDAINAYGGSLTLNGVTVEADGSGMDAIFVKAGNILVKNSTLIAPKAGIDASQSDTAATIVVDGGTFGVYAGAEDKSRSCAIEFRNDNKNITLKGDIKFENNVIIRRNDCTKELEQLITFGDESKDSTITNTDKTYSNDSNTWRFSTIDYKYTASSVPTAKPTTQPTTQPTAAPTAEPTAQPTAAPTAKPTETVVYPCIQTSHDAYAISTITAPTGYYLQSVTLDKAWVGIVFPGWAVHNDGTATFEVYAFDTDLDTSAAGAALLSETIQIKEIAQNEHRFATSLPAGKYVFKISNLGGTAPHFGIGQKLPDIDTDVAINEVAVSNEFDPNVHAVIINYITSGNSSENPSEPKETIIYPCIQTNHDAQGLTTVTTPSGFYLQSVTLDKSWVGIVYPGWCEPNDGTATFEVYAFDTDFDTSISGTAILSETIKVHQIPFNKHMFAKSLPAGKYVFKISNIAGTGVHFGIGQKLSNIDTEISIYEVAVSIPFDPTQHALIMNYIVSDISADEPNENTEHLIPSAGSNVVVDSNKAIASGIAAQSSTAAVIAQFKNSGNVQVVDKNGNVLSASALVGTGCKVQLVDNGTVKDEATIVIKGEIDGNGVIDSDDAIYLLRNTLFAGLYPVVTEDDVDGNGKYDSDDAIHLLRYTLFPNLYPLK